MQWKYCVPFFAFFMGDTMWIKQGSLSGKKKQQQKSRSNLLEYSEEYFIQKLNVTSVVHKRFKQSAS